MLAELVLPQKGSGRKSDILALSGIDAALASETTPLRLALGDDAFDSIRAHSEDLLAELAKWETTARAVNHDDAEQAA